MDCGPKRHRMVSVFTDLARSWRHQAAPCRFGSQARRAEITSQQVPTVSTAASTLRFRLLLRGLLGQCPVWRLPEGSPALPAVLQALFNLQSLCWPSQPTSSSLHLSHSPTNRRPRSTIPLVKPDQRRPPPARGTRSAAASCPCLGGPQYRLRPIRCCGKRFATRPATKPAGSWQAFQASSTGSRCAP